MLEKGGEEPNCEDFNLLRDATKKLYIVALLFAWVDVSKTGDSRNQIMLLIALNHVMFSKLAPEC